MNKLSLAHERGAIIMACNLIWLFSSKVQTNLIPTKIIIFIYIMMELPLFTIKMLKVCTHTHAHTSLSLLFMHMVVLLVMFVYVVCIGEMISVLSAYELTKQ